MQHLQHGMKSLLKFTITLPWLLLRRILRHIILLVPSFSSTTSSSHLPLVTVCASDSAVVVDYVCDTSVL